MNTKNYLRIAVALALALLSSVAMAHGIGVEALLLAPAAAAAIDELAAEFKTKNTELGARLDELKSMHEEVKGRFDKDGKFILPDNLKASIDKCLTDFNGLKGTVDELEQKLSNRAANDDVREKSWGEQFVEGASYKAAAEGGDASSKRHTMGVQVKQVTSTAAGGLIRSARETDIVRLERERQTIRDLLRTVPVNTSSVDYAVQSTRTNAAAPVAEGALKPYSDYTWGTATVVVRTLAHLAKITRQAMDDAPRLIGEIDSEMRYGLGLVEEAQFLYGTGVGQNLHGIVPQATAFALPAGFATIAGATNVDVLRVAMLQGALALLPPDGIVLSAAAWAGIELQKTNDGAYLFANPQGQVSARMWGLPVVATPAMGADEFLVGNFRMGATIYDRMGVEVLISTENVDDFERNLATMRAEERVAIAVKRPGAFIHGTFATARPIITTV